MDLKRDFKFEPLPPVAAPLRFRAAATGSPLGPLRDLPGTWVGNGFNVIWRPNSGKDQDHFLELNLTEETLQFEEIPGSIPNRGLLQADIEMFGLTYLQQIKDKNVGAGLHIEPGIWAHVPQTDNPAVPATVVRMASVPHGTTLLAQGIATTTAAKPVIPAASITPFEVGDSTKTVPFDESILAKDVTARSPASQIIGINQGMLDNPNSVLESAIANQNIVRTVQLFVSSSATDPVIGGGVANTAFLEGIARTGGPNAAAALVSSTFWIEEVETAAGAPSVLQLQYTQTVLLNFNGLSWPHITVATLRKS